MLCEVVVPAGPFTAARYCATCATHATISAVALLHLLDLLLLRVIVRHVLHLLYFFVIFSQLLHAAVVPAVYPIATRSSDTFAAPTV